MKLAEALNQRADLQKRIAQLRERLANNVKVQEGDQPAEKPEDLFRELEGSLKQLKDLIVSINRTNQETVWEGKTLTETPLTSAATAIPGMKSSSSAPST